MDVRSIDQIEMLPMHHGTTPVWWLVEPRSMKEATRGGYLELVAEFAVEGGGAVAPHSHHTHEYYYVLSGKGVMTIDGKTFDIGPGDAILTRPGSSHGLKQAGADDLVIMINYEQEPKK